MDQFVIRKSSAAKRGAEDTRDDDELRRVRLRYSDRLTIVPNAAPFPISDAVIEFPDSMRSYCFNTICRDDLDLLHGKRFFPPALGHQFMSWLLHELPWYRVEYTKGNIHLKTPRFTTTFGVDDRWHPGIIYDRAPRRIPPALQSLVDLVSELTGACYNFVLVNYYHDGQDSISFHSDDEPFLGANPTIASLSLGGTRDFLLKHKTVPTKKMSFTLEHGDMLVMRGKTQHSWLHSVPKRAGAGVRPRINVTMRRALDAAGTNNYYKYVRLGCVVVICVEKSAVSFEIAKLVSH
eukprot:TRINITY_DN1490_c0_g1_i2.p1 TRINITY_DN1490_c0_g1~~TRINITY_DN1490_c0_g1_i2.p1  ORF type:complete len:306 (-),score=27.26 TRINITY_DN1490_c0_g1_i2:359-1237(-)